MTPSPRFAFIPALGHEIHVTEWGNPKAPPLIMWHGLARNGRDFDELAGALADDYFILCPDTIGRGRSSWAKSPETEYTVPHYAQIALALLDHYGIAETAWLGTSMGGLIGMGLAASPLRARLSCLILNDIGPEIPPHALARIMDYAQTDQRFDSHSAAEAWLRETYAPFGPAPDSFWARLARTSLRRTDDGALTLHYDPAITAPFAAAPEAQDIWPLFESITTPTHVIRGDASDILPTSIAERMSQCGPEPAISAIADCGHAPSLSRPEDAALIAACLKELA